MAPQSGRLFVAEPRVLEREAEARETHSWAVALFAKRFTTGLEGVFQNTFVATRAGRFVRKHDPVYETLIQGLGDDALGRILVSNWAVAHTLATQSRFWLEDAIIDLLAHPERHPGGTRPRVYSLQMLADGWHLSGRSIWDLGEHWREELHGRGGWHPLIERAALEEADRIVGEEERQFEEALAERRRRGSYERVPDLRQEADHAALARVAGVLGKGQPTPVTVRCNLLVMYPELPGQKAGDVNTWGVRYINPSTFNESGIVKGERANLLRLFAYLMQEKPLRAPGRVRVVAADLLPRPHSEDGGRARNHFSDLTRWSSKELWSFLGVPFPAVTAGIRDAAHSLGDQLRIELTGLLRAED